MNESNFFLASLRTSLDDFLKTGLCTGKSIYCSFPRDQIDVIHIKEMRDKKVASIQFSDGSMLLYPFA